MYTPRTMTAPTESRDAWLLQLRATMALGKVLRRFEAAGIDALPVKGIITSRVLYTDISERRLGDVDVRIRPRDYGEVLRVVEAEGWRVVQKMRSYRNVVFLVDDVFIDVEADVAAPGLCAFGVDDLIARAEPSTLLGYPHLLVDFTDHAVLLALNVFKDKLVQAFRWSMQDVERLPGHAEWDTGAFVDRLAEGRVRTIGWIVADWMVRERGVEAWAAVRGAIGARPPRRAYAEVHGWMVGHLKYDALALRLWNRAGADAVGLRAKAVVSAVVWSGEAVLSRFGGAAPFVRKVMPEDVLVPRRR